MNNQNTINEELWPWVPNYGEEYWYISDDKKSIYSTSWFPDIANCQRYALGNCFKSKAEAIYFLIKTKIEKAAKII